MIVNLLLAKNHHENILTRAIVIFGSSNKNTEKLHKSNLHKSTPYFIDIHHGPVESFLMDMISFWTRLWTFTAIVLCPLPVVIVPWQCPLLLPNVIVYYYCSLVMDLGKHLLLIGLLCMHALCKGKWAADCGHSLCIRKWTSARICTAMTSWTAVHKSM